jgi:DNA polymerase-3 subunit epsilon
MREIVLDTEATGLDPYQGHRLIEIGCVGSSTAFRAGRRSTAISIERDVPAEAFAVTASRSNSSKTSRCSEIVDDLVAFIADAPLVAHNAMFDLGFLNAELDRAGKTLVARERLVDTLLLARRKQQAG